MKRREFIAGLGSAAAWPVVARAQQGERMRRVGVLSVGDDTANPNLAFALQEELAKLGWAEGRNLRLEVRFGANDEARIRAYAAELVGLAPDVIVSSGAAATRAVQEQTQMIPIVILGAGDIFTNGFVKDLAHPEGVSDTFTTPKSADLKVISRGSTRRRELLPCRQRRFRFAMRWTLYTASMLSRESLMAD